MLGIGPWEIAIIIVLALLIIGPRKLPEVMRSVGKGLFELRKASSDFRRTLEHEVHQEERKEQDDRIMEERRKYMEQLKAQNAQASGGDDAAEAGEAAVAEAKAQGGGDDAATSGTNGADTPAPAGAKSS